MYTHADLAEAAGLLGIDILSRDTKGDIEAKIVSLLTESEYDAPRETVVEKIVEKEVPIDYLSSGSGRTQLFPRMNHDGSGSIRVFRDGRMMHTFTIHREGPTTDISTDTERMGKPIPVHAL